MWSLSDAILLSAVLSRTTTQSAHCVSLFSVNKELYGCTTTSLKEENLIDLYSLDDRHDNISPYFILVWENTVRFN